MKKPKRTCKGCRVDISHKHPNAKFHSLKCKDKWHNKHNPRGHVKLQGTNFSACHHDEEEYDPSWDSHKDSW